jgi:prepilin-type N-terminal cleavage/methylation domain-containing protein
VDKKNAVRRAFTLVELLAVIAIIGVLAAIMIPVVAKTRGMARNTLCISNLRQLHTATMLYVGDRGCLPQRWGKTLIKTDDNDDIDPSSKRIEWDRNLYYYLKLQHDNISWMADGNENVYGREALFGPLFCPGDSRKTTGARTDAEWDKLTGGGTWTARSPSYSMNSYLAGQNDYAGLGSNGHTLRMAEITRNPILFFDGSSFMTTPDASGYNPAYGTYAGIRFRHGAATDDYDILCHKGQKPAKAKDHGHANAIHMDGSVAKYGANKLPIAGPYKNPTRSSAQKIGALNGFDLWMPWEEVQQ